MSFVLDVEAITALFTLPQNDGAFDPDHTAYLRALGRRRPSVLLAFPPKSAGTFLRTAAIHAVDGQLVRIVHAQGGRDATPYLPVFIRYLAGGIPSAPLVTHVHMQALPANCRFIEALGLKPAIVLRSIPDMLVSYMDMLDAERAGPANWLNVAIPASYATLGHAAKADLVIDILMPWYASYYATWLPYAADRAGSVLTLRYGDIRRDPVSVLGALLAHAGLPRDEAMCELAVAAALHRPEEQRFNKGIEGRGQDRFSRAQHERIARFIAHYPELDDWHGELLPGVA